MALARSRLRVRRVEFMRANASLNLIPLVDILTAIVFFSLVSLATLRGALASFDLTQPPTVPVTRNSATAAAASAAEIVVRVDRNQFVVRHSGGETLIARGGAPDVSLVTLQRALIDLTRQGRAHVTVVPSDDVLYDDLVRVLDEVHRVTPHAVSLGTRARQ
jgi:biopolymer transport protein ExbD